MPPLADRNLATAPQGQLQSAPAPQPFFGLIDAVIVEDPVLFPFDGSVLRKHVQTAWTWAVRDLCSDLLGDGTTMPDADIEVLVPQVLARMRDGLKQAERLRGWPPAAGATGWPGGPGTPAIRDQGFA